MFLEMVIIYNLFYDTLTDYDKLINSKYTQGLAPVSDCVLEIKTTIYRIRTKVRGHTS